MNTKAELGSNVQFANEEWAWLNVISNIKLYCVHIDLRSDRSLLSKFIHSVSKQTWESINFCLISQSVMFSLSIYAFSDFFKEDEETDSAK